MGESVANRHCHAMSTKTYALSSFRIGSRQSGIAERSQEFASQVSWQKVDERTGAEIPEEDITDGADDNTSGGGATPPSGDLEG